jgi:hypothetical protein
MSFVDLTQGEEEEEEDLAELADIGLGSPWLPPLNPPTSTSTSSSKKSNAKEIAPHLPLGDDDDDEFDLGQLDSIYGTTTSSSSTTTTSTSAAAPKSSASSAAVAASSKRKRAASKQQRRQQEEEDDQGSSDEEEGAAEQRSGAKQKPAKPKANKAKAKTKKKAKRTAPEEDVLVLIDAHLASEKDGDQYISVCQKPDKEKKYRPLPVCIVRACVRACVRELEDRSDLDGTLSGVRRQTGAVRCARSADSQLDRVADAFRSRRR